MPVVLTVFFLVAVWFFVARVLPIYHGSFGILVGHRVVFDVDMVTFYLFFSILLSLIQFNIASQKPNPFSCCTMSHHHSLVEG